MNYSFAFLYCVRTVFSRNTATAVVLAMIVACGGGGDNGSNVVVDPLPPPGTSGAGPFAERPYLFKAAEARLRASIAAGEPEATGSSANNPGQPIGFITLAKAAHANRSGFGDVPGWHIALAGWLTNDTAMMQRARDEAMAIVNAAPGGDNDRSSNFQHVEDRLLEVAAVADLAHAQFTPDQLGRVATWVNGTLANWNTQNTTYWPFDDPLNNYWQNGLLAHAIGGIATEGFNTSAASWRAKTVEMAAKFRTTTTPPTWNGPVQTEGHYYASYVAHALWAMQLYDAAMGTKLVADAAFSFADHLNLVMYQTRPHLANFFEVGSEANNAKATHTGVSLRYWHVLINAAGPNVAEAREAKAILGVAMADAENIWARNDKAFANFYWSIRAVPSVPLSAKADRLYVAPTPGAGLIGVRSATGFQTSARAALMFANNFTSSPGYSHANPDAPGFQWASGADWLVTDPEFFNASGVLAEAGSNVYSDVSNIVTLAGQKYNPGGKFPIIRFAEDNRSAAVPHQYVQIDAQPYWSAASVYRREYVWMDDLQVVLIFDRIVGAPAKSWRLHIPPVPVTINGATASYSVNGSTVTVHNLHSTGNTAWTSEPAYGATRLRQDDSATDYSSLKLLYVGGRVSAVAVTAGAGFHEASLIIGGVQRRVRFSSNDSTRAVVQ